MLPREARHGGWVPEPVARALTRLAVTLATAAIAVAIAACGDENAGSGGGATTELTLTLDVDGSGGEPPRHASLSCPGGSGPACDAVAALPTDPAAPVPAQTACTEIYGGPETVAIEGTIDDEPVDATLTRANGCEIDRFDRFAKVLEQLFPDYEPGGALGPQ